MAKQIPELSQIACYRILSKLGHGAMGEVYKAVQEQLDRTVALKVLPARLAEDKKFCTRFVREAKAAASVIHPNVVTCYDVGQENGLWYMALEFVTGGDAEQLIKQSKTGMLTESKSLSIIRDCARGLDAIHQAHLVHRDIKPANIFIAEDGSAKLADLGLAFFTDDNDRLTMPGAVMGSPAYMPPEQARGDQEIDIRADIYGLGAALFHLCCGRPPFMSKTALSTLQQVLNEALPDPRVFNPDLSADCVAILQMALEKDRDKRYVKPSDLVEDLECVLAGRTLMYAKPEKKRRTEDQRQKSKRASHIEQRQQAQLEELNQARNKSQDAPDAATMLDKGFSQAAVKDVAAVPSARGNNARPSEPILPAITANLPQKLDRKKLESLCQRVRVDELGILAWLNLAPQASFPREILNSMLTHLSITYGVDAGAIVEATRVSTSPRRIVLARGDQPSPGFPGRSIYDSVIAPLDEHIVIRISDDRMTAFALFIPNILLGTNEVKAAIISSGICYGIDVDAIHRLSNGPPEASGRLLIARGRRGSLPLAAGFRLLGDVMNTTIADVASANFQKVAKGDVVATWSDAVPVVTGMDVMGRRIDYPAAAELKPEDCVGDGVEVTRDRDGRLVLKALLGGVCQLQSHGQIRIVDALEINGDLTPDHGAIRTNELLIVRGDVADGVEIESGSDVVIMGDLRNAKIRTSGSVIVDGQIEGGEESIIAAGAIQADGIKVRRVMAGSVCIRGAVINSELIATGDIVVDRVVGGRLCAGGSITALDAGDDSGVTTELWSGHNLDYGEQKEMAKVEERLLSQKRAHLIVEQRKLDEKISYVESRHIRLQAATFVKEGEGQQLAHELEALQKKQQLLDKDGELMRGEISQRRQTIVDLAHLNNCDGAVVMVNGTAHQGVIVKLADAEAEIFKSDNEKVHRRIQTNNP